MPAETRGSVFNTRAGFGIRWPEEGRRPQRVGFKTKTEARRWFADRVAPRLRDGSPSSEITFDVFCDLYLERHGATVSRRTKETITERLVPAREHFGAWMLRDLENAADDVAPLARRSLGHVALSADRRHAAGVERRDAVALPPPEPCDRRRSEPDAAPRGVHPLQPGGDRRDRDRAWRSSRPAAVFAVETGLRTNEWIALERRDVDRAGRAVVVERRVADGVVTPYPKTERARRRVPLTTSALLAFDALPARLDTRILFPAPEGGYVSLDNWRTREWYPALEAAGIERRGPYHLRHTFATEALASGISIFELSRVMGASVKEIDRTYGHLARDSEEAIRARLEARSNRSGVDLASDGSSSPDS